MDDFLRAHEDAIAGTLTMFDRVIFRGYLSNLLSAARRLLYS